MWLAYLALAGRIVLTGYEKIIFKQVAEKSGSVEAVFLIFSTGTVFLTPLVFTVQPPESYGFLWIATLASLVYTVQTVFYLKALSRGEASLVAPVYYFGLFFLLFLTTVFLDESLDILKIFGIVLLIYGMSFLNRKQHILHSIKAVLTDKACQLMMVSSLLVAVGRTVDGFMVRTVHPIIYAYSLCIITCLFLLLYLLFTRRLGTAIGLFKSKWKIGSVAGAVDIYSYQLLIFAITRIEVSIAEPASMLGMIVTVLLAHFILKEKIRDRLIGVVIMIAGAWFLFL
jgi:transporter family protein